MDTTRHTFVKLYYSFARVRRYFKTSCQINLVDGGKLDL